MGEPHVVSALWTKRSEVAGLIAALERRIDQHRADLRHVDATLRLFAPEIKPETIPARRPKARNDWFSHGECLRRIYDVLRDAPEPARTGDIARPQNSMSVFQQGERQCRTGTPGTSAISASTGCCGP